MLARGIPPRAGWLAVVALLVWAGTAGAQSAGTNPPPWTTRGGGGGNTGGSTGKFQPLPGSSTWSPPNRGVATGGTTGDTGTTTDTTGDPGGSADGLGLFGLFDGVLTPEQEMAVLLNTFETVAALMEVIQPRDEMEILMLVLMVYTHEYMAAVEEALAGGGSGTTDPGSGTDPTTGGTTFGGGVSGTGRPPRP